MTMLPLLRSSSAQVPVSNDQSQPRKGRVSRGELLRSLSSTSDRKQTGKPRRTRSGRSNRQKASSAPRRKSELNIFGDGDIVGVESTLRNIAQAKKVLRVTKLELEDVVNREDGKEEEVFGAINDLLMNDGGRRWQYIKFIDSIRVGFMCGDSTRLKGYETERQKLWDSIKDQAEEKPIQFQVKLEVMEGTPASEIIELFKELQEAKLSGIEYMGGLFGYKPPEIGDALVKLCKPEDEQDSIEEHGMLSEMIMLTIDYVWGDLEAANPRSDRAGVWKKVLGRCIRRLQGKKALTSSGRSSSDLSQTVDQPTRLGRARSEMGDMNSMKNGTTKPRMGSDPFLFSGKLQRRHKDVDPPEMRNAIMVARSKASVSVFEKFTNPGESLDANSSSHHRRRTLRRRVTMDMVATMDGDTKGHAKEKTREHQPCLQRSVSSFAEKREVPVLEPSSSQTPKPSVKRSSSMKKQDRPIENAREPKVKRSSSGRSIESGASADECPKPRVRRSSIAKNQERPSSETDKEPRVKRSSSGRSIESGASADECPKSRVRRSSIVKKQERPSETDKEPRVKRSSSVRSIDLDDSAEGKKERSYSSGCSKKKGSPDYDWCNHSSHTDLLSHRSDHSLAA